MVGLEVPLPVVRDHQISWVPVRSIVSDLCERSSRDRVEDRLVPRADDRHIKADAVSERDPCARAARKTNVRNGVVVSSTGNNAVALPGHSTDVAVLYRVLVSSV